MEKRMTATQRRYLEKRILDASSKKRSRLYRFKLAEPASVRRARRLVAKWDRMQRTARERQRVRVLAQTQACFELLYGGEYDRTLKAVKSFERS